MKAMRRRLWFSVSVAALPIAFSGGCKRDSQTAPTAGESTPTETRTTSAEAAMGQQGALSSEDREFMTEAAQGGMLEVALGNAVASKATSPEVKAFAQRMVTDHGKANSELKQLAAKKGVTLSTQLDSKHNAKVEEMSELSGAKLDKEYADDMVDDHEDDVKEFRKASQNVKDPDLKAWAAKRLPILESHLAMAKDVEAKTKMTR